MKNQELDKAKASISKTVDILDELTPDQQQKLNESIQQADNGQIIPHEEVKKKAKEWLSK